LLNRHAMVNNSEKINSDSGNWNSESLLECNISKSEIYEGHTIAIGLPLFNSLHALIWSL
jgi:hypothetical protein